MVALMKEPRMHHQPQNRLSLPVDLCGPYVCDEFDSRTVRCVLQFDRTEVAVDIPASILREHRLSGERGEVVLRVPGEQTAFVDVMPVLTESQRKSAAGWSVEMTDFDRF